jgi:uncharacterized MAPEG superfamily protein
MSLAHWTVLIAALLPFITVGIAKAERSYDNRDPRGWLARQQGYRLRAHSAHLNHFESFAPFAAAVLLAQQAGAAQDRIDTLALVYLLARIAYTVAYLADRDVLRSLCWVLGLAMVVWLFLLPALG